MKNTVIAITIVFVLSLGLYALLGTLAGDAREQNVKLLFEAARFGGELKSDLEAHAAKELAERFKTAHEKGDYDACILLARAMEEAKLPETALLRSIRAEKKNIDKYFEKASEWIRLGFRAEADTQPYRALAIYRTVLKKYPQIPKRQVENLNTRIAAIEKEIAGVRSHAVGAQAVTEARSGLQRIRTERDELEKNLELARIEEMYKYLEEKIRSWDFGDRHQTDRNAILEEVWKDMAQLKFQRKQLVRNAYDRARKHLEQNELADAARIARQMALLGDEDVTGPATEIARAVFAAEERLAGAESLAALAQEFEFEQLRERIENPPGENVTARAKKRFAAAAARYALLLNGFEKILRAVNTAEEPLIFRRAGDGLSIWSKSISADRRKLVITDLKGEKKTVDWMDLDAETLGLLTRKSGLTAEELAAWNEFIETGMLAAPTRDAEPSDTQAVSPPQ